MDSINATYTKDYCRQLELAYGQGMMSEGGQMGLDKMVKGLPLKGQHVLDFGAGLGGAAYYLAETYGAHVTGVEINPWMVSTATLQTPSALKNKVSFALIDADQTLPFPNNHFDLVYSKGVITHLLQDQREATFQEFYRVLREEGKLIIYDFLSPTDGVWGPKVQALIETENLPLFAYSPETYRIHLQNAGFQEVTTVNASDTYTEYNQAIVDRLKTPPIKHTFITEYGEDTYQEHVTGYENIRDALESGELMQVALASKKTKS